MMEIYKKYMHIFMHAKKYGELLFHRLVYYVSQIVCVCVPGKSERNTEVQKL